MSTFVRCFVGALLSLPLYSCLQLSSLKPDRDPALSHPGLKLEQEALPPTAQRLLAPAGQSPLRPSLQNSILSMELGYALAAAIGLTGDVTTALSAVKELHLLLHAPPSADASLQPMTGWRLESNTQQIWLVTPSTEGPTAIKVAGCSIAAESMPARMGMRFYHDAITPHPATGQPLPWTSESARHWLIVKSVQTGIGMFARSQDRFPSSWEEVLAESGIAPAGYTWMPASTPHLPETVPPGVSILIHEGHQLFQLVSDSRPRPLTTQKITWTKDDRYEARGEQIPAQIPASEWVWWGTMQFPE